MDASVIIPTHNRRDWVLRAVAALMRQDYPRDSYEVIVCCDRCTDGTEEALRVRFGCLIRLAGPRVAGKVGALNAALHISQGKLAIFLDDEIEVDEGFVSAHVRAHQAEPLAKIAVVGYYRVVVDHNSPPLTRELARFYDEFFEDLEERQRKRARSTPMDLGGSNFSIPLTDLREIGAFNEAFSFPRDDFELAARLLQSGYEFRFCRAASASMIAALDPSAYVSRAAEQARNDCKLAHTYPACIAYLPFYPILRDPFKRARCRVWWEFGHVGAAVLRAGRTLAPKSLRLMNWEFAARYYSALRSEVGSWTELSRMCQAPRGGEANLNAEESP